jgi:four helix bundle protein
MGNFRALRAWQEARKLAGMSSAAIDRMPRAEQQALAAQWRRAVYSVVLNLAEGAAQRSTKVFRRYVWVARGSLDELEAILDLVRALGFLTDQELLEIERSRVHCARMVAALLRKLDQLSS